MVCGTRVRRNDAANCFAARTIKKYGCIDINYCGKSIIVIQKLKGCRVVAPTTAKRCSDGESTVRIVCWLFAGSRHKDRDWHCIRQLADGEPKMILVSKPMAPNLLYLSVSFSTKTPNS